MHLVGMRDVAKAAGVSLSTVSLVVNNTGYISDAMRERVQQAMDELGYVPNELARNFYRDRTNIIGIIVPTINHPFFASFTASLQKELAGLGFSTLLCSTVDAKGGEAQYVDMLRRHMMDGIVMAAHTSHAADYWTSIQRPIVAFDRYLGAGIPSVRSDHPQGGRLIAQQLIRTHAKHVVSVGGPVNQFHDLEDGGTSQSDTDQANCNDQGKESSFPTVRYHMILERELAAANIRYDYVDAGEVYDWKNYPDVARMIFERFPDVDAIVGSDLIAAHCVREAGRRRMSIPGQVQVIAYDGTYLTQAAGKVMTTISQDCRTIARHIGSLIVEQIHSLPRSPRREVPSVKGSGPVSSGKVLDDPSNVVQDLDVVVPVSLVSGQTTKR